MKLIVGLGNPGKEYASTRHNAGFLMIDKFADREKLKRSKNKEWNAEIAKGTVADQEIILCKPLTFMNKSGESVGKAAKFYKIKPEDILVIHDEIDLPSGMIQLKVGGGTAGHNGLKDLVTKLGTNTFSRIRMGVDRPQTKEEVADYVLHDFSKRERSAFEEKEQEIFDIIYTFIGK